MRKDNRGFTLIELLIAVSVLSIMGGVLLHSFVVSRRFNARARKEEVILNAGRSTMEALKSMDLSFLKDQQTISLGTDTYTCTLLTDTETSESMYRLTTANPAALPGYIIEADLCWNPYGDPADTTSETVLPNNYQIPKIANVSTPQNIVLDYDTLLQKEELWNIYFNSLYAEESDESGGGNGEDGGVSTQSSGPKYTIEDTRRYLYLKISDATTGSGSEAKTTLTVVPELWYILPGKDDQNKTIEVTKDNFKSFEGKSFPLGKVKRTATSGDTDKMPQIYLFLPNHEITVSYEKKKSFVDESYPAAIDGIFADTNLNGNYDFFVIPEQLETDTPTLNINKKTPDSGNLVLYTLQNENGAQTLQIPVSDARRRIYAVTVSVYGAKQNASGWEKKSDSKVLELNSTIRE
jgi:prepilin-type N-terminal cleavage/methylation domain-containing protein